MSEQRDFVDLSGNKNHVDNENMGSESQSKGKRLRAKCVLLTYPKCEKPLLQMKDDLKQVFLSYSFTILSIVLSSERHQDETLHRHAFIEFYERINIGDTLRDKMRSVGNGAFDLSTVRNRKKVIDYVIKDGVFICEPENFIELHRKSTQKITDRIAESLLNSRQTVAQIMRENPGFAMMNLQKIQAFQNLSVMICPPKISEKWIVRHSVEYPEITEWINQNLALKSCPINLPFRTQMLWIWSREPKMGKTTMANDLAERILTLRGDKLSDWWNPWIDQVAGLYVLDEFKSQKKIQDLNRWLDGQIPISINTKGSISTKSHNIPTLILSNFPPQEAYSSTLPSVLSTLLSRLIVVELTSFFRLHFETITELGQSTSALNIISSPKIWENTPASSPINIGNISPDISPGLNSPVSVENLDLDGIKIPRPDLSVSSRISLTRSQTIPRTPLQPLKNLKKKRVMQSTDPFIDRIVYNYDS